MHPHLQYPELDGFHLEQGLYFKRLEDGKVKILLRESAKVNTPVFREIVIDASSWASVLASVCARGEDGITHEQALQYHNKGSS